MAQRRLGIIAFLCWFCLCLLPCSAQAASFADAIEPISTESACSLTLSYTHNGTAFSGVPVKLYHVADVSAEFHYTLTAPFQSSGLILNGIQSAGEWDVVRSTLESYILANAIEADFTAVTNQGGQVQFAPLKPGLYLATAEDAVQNDRVYFFEPALIALPGLNTDGLWQYQITVAPKPGFLPPVTPDDSDNIHLKVLKLWKGENSREDRPQSIEVEIFRNGTSDRTVTLSEENHWSYTWTAEDDGTDWMVVERNVPEGYTVTVEERTTTFILTNTRIPDEPPSEEPPDEPPPEDPPPEDPSPEDPPEDLPPEDPPKDYPPTDSPKTGDTPHILLYTVLMYVSGIILILLGITGKRKRV